MKLTFVVFFLSIVWMSEAAAHLNEVLKIGGIKGSTIFEERAVTGYEIWKDWSNSAEANLDYSVEMNWIDIELSADQDVYNHAVQNMTDPSKCSSNCVDVLILPVTLGIPKVLAAMPTGSPIPLLIWASSLQSDFNYCMDRNLNCFGFAMITEYMLNPIFDAILSKTGSFTVAAIQEKNKTDNWVQTYTIEYNRGARTWIEEHDTATMVADVMVNMTQAGLSAEDTEQLDALMTARPDVVYVLGDFPVYALIKLQSSSEYRPKAIICTECYRPEVIYKITEVENKSVALLGVLLPDSIRRFGEWKDDITGWTNNMFYAMMEARNTRMEWDGASAAASGIALTHAMAAGNAGNRKTNLTANLKSVDIETLFSRVAFNADGTPVSQGQAIQFLGADFTWVPPNENLVYPVPGGHASWENEVSMTTIHPATTMDTDGAGVASTTILPATTTDTDGASVASTTTNATAVGTGGESSSEASGSTSVDFNLLTHVCLLLFVVSAHPAR